MLHKIKISHDRKNIAQDARLGFTVVELLVIIAVIGILASIIIIGFSNWRMMSARNEVRSDLGNLAASMESARNFGSGYPTTLPSSFKDSPTVTVTYISGSSTQYCVDGVSTVIGSVRYHIDSSQGKDPIEGSCVPLITNLSVNPSVESNASGWAIHAGLTGGRTQVSGKWMFQGTRNITGPVAIYPMQSTPIAITSGGTYTASVLVTSSVAQTIQLAVRQGGTSTTLYSSSVAVAANTPTRISATGVANVASIFPTVLSSTGSVGDVISADEVMIVAGSTSYGYADGNSSGWAWASTPNNSASTGPGL